MALSRSNKHTVDRCCCCEEHLRLRTYKLYGIMEKSMHHQRCKKPVQLRHHYLFHFHLSNDKIRIYDASYRIKVTFSVRPVIAVTESDEMPSSKTKENQAVNLRWDVRGSNQNQETRTGMSYYYERIFLFSVDIITMR